MDDPLSGFFYGKNEPPQRRSRRTSNEVLRKKKVDFVRNAPPPIPVFTRTMTSSPKKSEKKKEGMRRNSSLSKMLSQRKSQRLLLSLLDSDSDSVLRQDSEDDKKHSAAFEAGQQLFARIDKHERESNRHLLARKQQDQNDQYNMPESPHAVVLTPKELERTYQDMRERLQTSDAKGLRRELFLFMNVFESACREDRRVYGVNRMKKENSGSVRDAVNEVLVEKVRDWLEYAIKASKERDRLTKTLSSFDTYDSDDENGSASSQGRRLNARCGDKDYGAIVRAVLEDAAYKSRTFEDDEDSEENVDISIARYRNGDAVIICDGLDMFAEYVATLAPHNRAWKDCDEIAISRLREDVLRILIDKLERYILLRCASLTWTADRKDAKRLKTLRHMSIEDLDLDDDDVPNRMVLELASQELLRIVLVSSPQDKLRCVSKTWEIVSDSLCLTPSVEDKDRRKIRRMSKEMKRRAHGADDIFPVFIYVVLTAMVILCDRGNKAHGGHFEDLINTHVEMSKEERARIERDLATRYRHTLRAQIEYIEITSSASNLSSELGYCFAHLRSAVAFLSGDEIFIRVMKRLSSEESEEE